MVDKMQKNDIQVENLDDALLADAEDAGGGDGAAGGSAAKLKPNAPSGSGGASSDAERAAQMAANRARLQAQNAKK